MNLVLLVVFTVGRVWGGSGDRRSGRCVMCADTVDGNYTVVGGMDGYLAMSARRGGGQVVNVVSSSSPRVYRSWATGG
jgi:hypothetical protein